MANERCGLDCPDDIKVCAEFNWVVNSQTITWALDDFRQVIRESFDRYRKTVTPKRFQEVMNKIEADVDAVLETVNSGKAIEKLWGTDEC